MKKVLNILFALLCMAVILPLQACGDDDPNEPTPPGTETPDKPEVPDSGTPEEPDVPGTPADPSTPHSKALVAYFSWGGTTERMAQMIVSQTGADIFEIEPVVPYPTSYTPCTEVALEEKNTNARPAIKDRVEGWETYDVVFIGCPVWWWTTPMIIHTFCESYDFTGKTVVPFCTYAATYRDETLAEIVNITPDAAHLPGLGLTGGQISDQRIQTWIDLINEQWHNNNPTGSNDAVMTGKVDLWQKGNIPTVTRNVNNSDGPDFIPNLEVFTVPEEVQPKGAVMICPGGSRRFSRLGRLYLEERQQRNQNTQTIPTNIMKYSNDKQRTS